MNDGDFEYYGISNSLKELMWEWLDATEKNAELNPVLEACLEEDPILIFYLFWATTLCLGTFSTKIENQEPIKKHIRKITDDDFNEFWDHLEKVEKNRCGNYYDYEYMFGIMSMFRNILEKVRKN